MDAPVEQGKPLVEETEGAQSPQKKRKLFATPREAISRLNPLRIFGVDGRSEKGLNRLIEPKERFNDLGKYLAELSRIRGEASYVDTSFPKNKEGKREVNLEEVGQLLGQLRAKAEGTDESFFSVNINSKYHPLTRQVYYLYQIGVNQETKNRVVFVDELGRCFKRDGRIVTLNPSLFDIFSAQQENMDQKLFPIIGQGGSGKNVPIGAVVFQKEKAAVPSSNVLVFDKPQPEKKAS